MGVALNAVVFDQKRLRHTVFAGPFFLADGYGFDLHFKSGRLPKKSVCGVARLAAGVFSLAAGTLKYLKCSILT